ncbi:aminotransferase class I/II-fold pyridoxal phosphate-dependent enzyme [Schumannella luteola]|uniref:DNA-binding transcriptional MocR family regulator n=1 Tax=Schumannella luteola TaxID=472059 RepID=A0A852YJ67_9MICO|nr:aminotransferase class I/II-fold pyridoxal phosphate-dependent enzyme [Schumannella luteola]NYG97819.1 DNA-binding transcriptional MocR family regulator [Schumannella luteola]TPX02920.1 aminotransferase class I/II-fold pyridoxal phosphate-dependent enzyme [Schumannella luteola]
MARSGIPDAAPSSAAIRGTTAEEISDSIRDLVDAGDLLPGAALPPVRALAETLGVNRNTVVAAYRRLALAGVVVTAGRGGTSVAHPIALPEEGAQRGPAASAEVPHPRGSRDVCDIGHGNPDPRLLPDLLAAAARLAAGPTAASAPVVYGAPALDPALESWARPGLADDRPEHPDFCLTVASGAVDAVERLLAQHLTQGDAVALEDPCFLASIATSRQLGHRIVPVPVDAEGMTPDGLERALAEGVRAVVLTPRAHNPTGASLSAARADALRSILTGYPRVLVIEDDHFSELATTPYRTVVPRGHPRWALVRSVSKFLGPDLRLAVVAADPATGERLGARLSGGTTWVSHLLQRLAASLATDAGVRWQVSTARDHYRARNLRAAEVLMDALAAAPLRAIVPDARVRAGDGLNVWVDLALAPGEKPSQGVAVTDEADEARPSHESQQLREIVTGTGGARTPPTGAAVTAALRERGWRARLGADFALDATTGIHAIRLTAHELDDAQLAALAADLADAVRSASGATPPSAITAPSTPTTTAPRGSTTPSRGDVA